MNRTALFISVALLGLSTQQTFADGFCEPTTKSVALGPVSSLNVTSLGNASITGGLKCEGFSFALISPATLRYTAQSVPVVLTHSNGVNQARISIRDNNNNIVTSSTDRQFNVLNPSLIFGGASSEIPFYVSVNETTGLRPGVYSAVMRMKWYYAFPLASTLFYYKSPGLEVGFTFPGNPPNITKWGTGIDSVITIQLTVTPDCNIGADNINFGTKPLVSYFDSVTGTVRVTCSAQTPYTVTLSDGLNFSGSRRMKNTASSNYIRYDVFKNATASRWGSSAVESWSSDVATTNPGKYDGSIVQTYSYNAKITEPASTIAPEGTYKDTLTIEVKF